MSEIKEVSILLSDLEDVRFVLNAVGNYFTARDVSEAQTQLKSYNKSPLTVEIERVKNRMDGYLGDFLLSQYEHEHGLVSDEENENRLEEKVEVVEDEEALSDNPLGTVKVKRQQGRRLSKEEVAGDE